MPRADWRSPVAYEGLRSLDAPGFAWEFLSRNPDFERDCANLEAAEDRGELSAEERSRFARRWGVRFRNAGARPSSAALDGTEPPDRDSDSPAPAPAGRSEPAS